MHVTPTLTVRLKYHESINHWEAISGRGKGSLYCVKAEVKTKASFARNFVNFDIKLSLKAFERLHRDKKHILQPN